MSSAQSPIAAFQFSDGRQQQIEGEPEQFSARAAPRGPGPDDAVTRVDPHGGPPVPDGHLGVGTENLDLEAWLWTTDV